MQREFSFIVYKIRERYPSDLTHLIYFDILKDLMKINYNETVKYINSIETEGDMILVSKLFPYISDYFQRKDFLEVINNKLPGFRESKYFSIIYQNVKEVSKHYSIEQ